ncbi:MAG TPA: hypothetical protein VFG35_20530, partial [Actinoplanes sp.]|nr:hypothetical protein [Actinoplanes sp.]
MNVGITGIAYALPARTELTDDLQRRVAGDLAVPDGLFRRTTGIVRRRVAEDDEYASDLAIDAATKVLAETGTRGVSWCSRGR